MKQFLKPFIIIAKLSPAAFIFYIIITALAGLVPTAFIFINERFIDTVINYVDGTATTNALIIVCVLMTAISITPLIFNLLLTFANNAILRGLYRKFDLELLEKKINIKYEAIECQKTQLILTKMSDPKYSVHVVFQSACLMVKFSIASIGLMVYFSQLNILFLPAFLAMFAITMTMQTFKRKRDIAVHWGNADGNRMRNQLRWHFFQQGSQQELRTFSSKDYLIKRWDEETKQMVDRQLAAENKNTIGRLLIHLSTIAVTFFVMYTLIHGAVDNVYTLGMITASAAGIAQFSMQSRQFSNSFAEMAVFREDIKYYNEFMALPNRDIGTEQLNQNYEIEFKNVSFIYPNTDKQILNDVNIKFDPGKNTAIVGENGSGKSTIVKLLAGLYKPTSGTITVGGIDLNTISDEERFKLFGFVFQDINFYHTTLRENIAVGDYNKRNDDEALKLALKNADAEDLLKKVDNNLDTIVGYMNEQGITFSGGETQRLQIARAFLSPHKFVVLDEPVASLDAFAESKMYESFLNFFKDKGVIAISHRLASAKMADEIIMLENGTVAAIGRHTDLLKTNKLYKTMFTLQAKNYVETKEEEINAKTKKRQL